MGETLPPNIADMAAEAIETQTGETPTPAELERVASEMAAFEVTRHAAMRVLGRKPGTLPPEGRD